MVPTAISSADVPAVAAPSTPTSRSGDAAAFGDALGAAIADGGQETAGAQTPPTRPGPAPAAQDAAAADPSTAALVALLGRMAASGAKAGPAATTRTGDAPAADPHAEAGPAIADALGTGPAAQEPVAAAAGDTKAVADGAPAAAATAAVDPALLAIAAAAAAQAGAGAAPTAPQAAVTASGDAEAGAVRLGAGRSTTAGTAAAPSAGAPTDSGASEGAAVGAAAARPASADDRRAAVQVEDAAVAQPDATGAQQPAVAAAQAQAQAQSQAPDLRAHAERAAGTPDSAATAAFQPATAPAVGAAPAPAATAAPAAPAVPPTLAEQVHEPLVALRHAPEGDHVVVVRITPEHLGTVTVHATVHRGDLSVQLFASSSDARDQLKGMLTDLRRDLGTGGVGTATTLSLGTGDAPQQDTGRQAAAWTGSDASSGRPTWTDARGSAPRAPAATADQPAADLRPRTPGSALLDVLA